MGAALSERSSRPGALSIVRGSLREIILIVVGVLLAFGIESRWNDLQEAREDRGYIDAVRAELVANRSELEKSTEHIERVLSATDRLLGQGSGEALSGEEIARLTWSATSVVSITPASAALESLGDSVAWARLADPELQFAMSRLEQNLRILARVGSQGSAYWFDVVEPLLAENVDYATWQALQPDGPGGSNSPPIDPQPDLSAWTALMEDPRFRNRITHMRWFAAIIGRQTRLAMGDTDEILQRLPE